MRRTNPHIENGSAFFTTHHRMETLPLIPDRMSRRNRDYYVVDSSHCCKITVSRAAPGRNKQMKRQILNARGEHTNGEPFNSEYHEHCI